MSVDFVARALARQQQSGQGQSFTTLATGIPAVQIPAGVKVMQTSGYATDGTGAGTYVSDGLATAALATSHPRFCKGDAGGRYWRLLPDNNNLVPVSCGGANGITYATVSEETLIDSTTGLVPFISAPWLLFAVSLTAPGVTGPTGTGSATQMTVAGGSYCLIYRAAGGTKRLRARVKAGSAARVHLWSNADQSNPTALVACWFDLANGTITQDDFGTGIITPLGGGWYEIEVTTACYTNLGIGLSDADGTGTVTAGATALIFDFDFYNITEGSAASTIDDRPAIQAAISYAEAIGAAGTRYDQPDYLLRRVSRTLTAPNDIHADKSGLLLQTTKSHRFISTCGGTTLWRRDTDGSAMGKAKFDTCTGSGGYYWRGGGIFVEGQTTAPEDPSENSIYLYDMILDGGVMDSSEQNNPYGANMHSSGDGWDNSDKGIWQSNDCYCGHIVLEGRSGIRYFMGELIYSSGPGNAAVADREIRIGPDVDLGHTCGSCINGNGHTLKVERCRLHNAFMGFEGWTGHLGGYLKAVISDCNRNSLQGGIPNFGSGSFYQKTRPVATVVPMGRVDLVLDKAGTFEIGSWISGTIEAFDCYPNLGNQAAFTSGSQEVDLHVTTWADRGNVLAGVGLVGGASGSMQTDKVSLRVDCRRTDYAVANGYRVLQVAYTFGSFGPDVCVRVGANISPQYSLGPVKPAGAVYDNAIKVVGWEHLVDVGGVGFDIEANNNGTIDVVQSGNVVGFTCTNNGSYNANLPVTGIPRGYRLFLVNATNDSVAGGAACRIPAANFRNGGELIIPPGHGHAELEFDGSLWSVVVQPRALTTSITYDPPNVAAGASTTTTVSVAGAIVGDKVGAGFSNSLQGMVLSAYVSAANTVTAVLFNPTGSAINLASGTLRVSVA